jgi:hypothetical protein
MDSVYGQSNRWSLGTQLSNVSFTECTSCSDVVDVAVPPKESDELEKLQEWSTVETSESLFDGDDNIFHPDDEIILDPKDSMKKVFPLYMF